jgi:hypothetical protein
VVVDTGPKKQLVLICNQLYNECGRQRSTGV